MIPKILILDNRSDFLPDLKECLYSLGAEVEIANPLQEFPNERYNGIIISGGIIPRVSYRESFKWYKEFLQKFEIPVLGICLGHMILGISYGATWKRMVRPESGIMTVEFSESYPLAPGISNLTVYQDHEKELAHLPSCLKSHGSSHACRIQAMAHDNKPQFSVQFHPEVRDNNEGYKVLENFVNFVKI